MPEAGDGLVIGVDVGGTKVAAGFVDPAGRIIAHVRQPMVADGDAASGFAAVKSAIDALLVLDSKKEIHGIGICSPGPLDPDTGVVINPPNLPCWRNFPLASETGRIYRLPVKLDNDANAAGLAEALWGAGAGYRNVFYATIGTGIGTGLVFEGELYHGRTGAAGEGGHMSIDYRGPQCGCGKRGCIETLAAGPAIARRVQEKLAASGNHDSMLWGMANGQLESVSSEMVGRANAAGDPLARDVLAETVALLSVWLGNIIDLLEPDVIIMGGGVAAMLKPLFAEIRRKTSENCVNSRAHEIPLLPACYGTDSGIAGGAALCTQAATPIASAPVKF
ncbi:MAG TPA: ROK family protein [Terriglobales bacterium]|nr:ROK family protein [Terriglobales bacterium]